MGKLEPEIIIGTKGAEQRVVYLGETINGAKCATESTGAFDITGIIASSIRCLFGTKTLLVCKRTLSINLDPINAVISSQISLPSFHQHIYVL